MATTTTNNELRIIFEWIKKWKKNTFLYILNLYCIVFSFFVVVVAIALHFFLVYFM